MKPNLFVGAVTAGVLIAIHSAAVADPVSLSQVPAAVQEAIKASEPSAEVASVDKVVRNGVVLYDVVLNQPGNKNHLYFTEAGAPTDPQGPPARTPMANVAQINFGQLPMPVLSSIQNLAGASFIEKLEKGTLDGRTVYQARFTTAGKPAEVRVWDDGTLVNDRANTAFLALYQKHWSQFVNAGVGTPPASESNSGSGSGASVAPKPNPR